MINPQLRFHQLVAVTLVLLSVTLVASKTTAHRRSEGLLRPLETIPKELAGFSAVDNPPLEPAVLKELKATEYLTRTYQSADLNLDLFIAFYAQQRAGESMHSPKHCLPGGGWEIWDYGDALIPVTGKSVRVNRYSISHEGSRKVVLYWYQSKERIFASEYLGKVLLARDALFRNSTAAAIVRIIVDDKPGLPDRALGFASKVIPELEQCFGRRSNLSSGSSATALWKRAKSPEVVPTFGTAVSQPW